MKERKIRPFAKIVGILLVFCLIASVFAMLFWRGRYDAPDTAPTTEKTTFTTVPDPTPAEPQKPAEPTLVSKATIASTGDILIHTPLLATAKQSDGTYDFHYIFPQIKSYFDTFDYSVANLEVPLGGPEAGAYDGYPRFNSPDALATALKDAGVDMLLCANNHAADMGGEALVRTGRAVREAGMDVLGTRATASDPVYTVKEINGIPIGMACYTYGSISQSGTKSLNGGGWLSTAVSPLINVFDYTKIDAFYTEAQTVLSEMRTAGCAVTVFYMHWGNEYQYTPNTHQKAIAQKLCELGVDVIIGGHPHVIQPFETIHADNGNETLCIYSTGNAVSNQRKNLMDSDNYSGHTEDGMLFCFTVEQWSDGTYRLSDVDILPTWVFMQTSGGKRWYTIIPLDTSVPDWHAFGLDDAGVKDAKASYNRTMALVGEGLNEARAKLGAVQRPLSVS